MKRGSGSAEAHLEQVVHLGSDVGVSDAQPAILDVHAIQRLTLRDFGVDELQR